MKYFLIFALIGLTVSVVPGVFAEQRDPVLESSVLWEVGTIQWLEDVYSSTGTAVVRVIDPDRNQIHGEIENFDVDVWSDTDLAGLDLTVTETDISSGVFEGTVFFSITDDSSGHRLRISQGDTVFSKYADITIPKSDYDDLSVLIDTAMISEENPTQKIEDRIALDKESYEWGDTVTIMIIAPELNMDSKTIEEINNTEKFPVEITTRHFEIKEFSLVETDVDTGVFSGKVTLNADDLPSAVDRVDHNNDGITVNFEYKEDMVAIGSAPIIETKSQEFTERQICGTGTTLQDGICRVTETVQSAESSSKWNNPYQNITPPLKQIKSGIALADVKCKEGKHPAYKSDRMSVACVTSSTYSDLIDRGWASLRLETRTTSDVGQNLCIWYGGDWDRISRHCNGLDSHLMCTMAGGKILDDSCLIPNTLN